MYRNRYSIDNCKVGFSSVSLYFGLTWFQENGREFPHVTKETQHCSVFCNHEEVSVLNKCCQVKPVAFHHILLSTDLFLGEIKDFKSTLGISVMFGRENPSEITCKFKDHGNNKKKRKKRICNLFLWYGLMQTHSPVYSIKMSPGSCKTLRWNSFCAL